VKQLVLVGGGHTHIEVLRRWARRPVAGWQVCVVSRDLRPVYSGMVPGHVAGQYRADELGIDLAKLAARAGARLVHRSALRVDAARRRVVLSDGVELPYDLASLDVGSTVAGRELPGVSQYAIASRPIGSLIDCVARALPDVAAATSPVRVVVVGAGAAGVELAFCVQARLLNETGARDDAGDDRVRVGILDASERVLPGASDSLARRVLRAMGRRHIDVLPSRRVQRVEPGGVHLDDGETLPADLVLWVTGAAALPLATDSQLPTDAGGFVRIQPTLQVEGHPELFAVGDCASLPGMQRAGVYAVRAGPVLDRNLRAAAAGATLRPYRPQRDFLTLLNLGDGTAIGAKWGISFEGRWVLALKDRIDRGFMARYA
jgi:selenide,water dikinase